MTLNPFQGLRPLSLHNGASLGHYLYNNVGVKTVWIFLKNLCVLQGIRPLVNPDPIAKPTISESEFVYKCISQ